MKEYKIVQGAELELLTSSTRRNAARLRQLLHPDFVEIGRSGRRWTCEEIIASRGMEDERSTPETDEWGFIQLTRHIVLVTYRIHSGSMGSGHASVWETSGDQVRIRFHQGTTISK